MSTVTISLPEALANRLAREATQRSVTQDLIVRQALEQTLPREAPNEPGTVFEKLTKLIVDDPESPSDLATNPTHMEGFGVSRPA